MSDADRKSAKRQQPRYRNPAFFVVSTAADTSWRMFLPIIGGAGGGLILDQKLGTKPWLMISLMILGIALAAALIRRQLKSVNALNIKLKQSKDKQ